MSKPRTAVIRLRSLTVEPDGKATIRFWHPDPHHEALFWALLEKAAAQDYSIQVSLIEYEGERDMVEQARARKARLVKDTDLPDHIRKVCARKA